jgi:hypothetical protein
MEADAAALESQADDTEREIQAIEQQKAQLEQEFNQRIGELDKQRTNLLGTSTSLF